MYVGIDIGTTLIKVVSETGDGGLNFEINPHRFTPHCTEGPARGYFKRLKLAGVTRVALTGSGAKRFARLVREEGIEIVSGLEDPVQQELRLQVQGVRRLLLQEGVSHEQFLLVSIGTGTSFTRVVGDEVTQYQPGLSVGGSTIVQIAASHGINPSELGELAESGTDVDLLMEHLYPDAGMLQKKFVLASMGRLDQEGASKENLAAGLIKMVATLTIGHILSMRNHTDWVIDGPVVFVGTPVSAYEQLAGWLTLFTTFLGLRSCIPANASFAGALGALHLAQTGEILGEVPEPSRTARAWSLMRHLFGVARVIW